MICSLSVGVEKAKDSYLELFNLQLDGLDVGAEPQMLELFQFHLHFPQPSTDIIQVRVELLPFLEILLHPQLLAQGLGLYEFPAVNHT